MTIITSKMAGKCGICGKQYPEGTRITKDTKTNKWVEADCLWPSKKRDANANPTPAKVAKLEHPTAGQQMTNATREPALLSPTEALEMLKDAIAEVQKELTDVDNAELIPLIAEHYGAKLQAQQQRFSLAMSNYVQALKLSNMGLMQGV